MLTFDSTAGSANPLTPTPHRTASSLPRPAVPTDDEAGLLVMLDLAANHMGDCGPLTPFSSPLDFHDCAGAPPPSAGCPSPPRAPTCLPCFGMGKHARLRARPLAGGLISASQAQHTICAFIDTSATASAGCDEHCSIPAAAFASADLAAMEHCRLGGLPDLNQSRPFVREKVPRGRAAAQWRQPRARAAAARCCPSRVSPAAVLQAAEPSLAYSWHQHRTQPAKHPSSFSFWTGPLAWSGGTASTASASTPPRRCLGPFCARCPRRRGRSPWGRSGSQV